MIKYCSLLSLLLVACGPTIAVDHADDGALILIRSPQPNQEDLETLNQKYSLGTIINLRRAEIIRDIRSEWHTVEKEFCDQNNILYLNMDLGDGTVPPDEDTIDLYLHITKTSVFWPILIHCQAGIHRTGFFAALYRIQHNGWDAERAIEEMESYWYNWGTSDRSAIKKYLRNYQRRK